MNEGDTIVVPMVETAKVIPPVQTVFSPSINVNVIGEVTNPGTYQISAKANLLDVLTLAGGPTSNANLEKTMITHSKKSEGEQQIKVDLQEVMTEGSLELLPTMLPGDTVFLPKLKEKRNWWSTIVRTAADFSIILVAYYLLTEGRYYR